MSLPGLPIEILVAPDSFKGTFSATEVACALQTGLAASGQPASACPVADGGEGTLEALADVLELELMETTVSDPLGRPVQARFGLGGRGTAVVEVAAASGLGLVAPQERDAVAASSYGTGELIATAIDSGAREVFLAAGGSGTNDGGEGAVQALLDAGGLRGTRLVVLCDVRTPFEEAVLAFAPQKGASPVQVEFLAERLSRQAQGYARDPRGLPMTGAAGGLSGGLWAELGAELEAGAPFVLGAIGFDARMRASRAVVTGEGRLDSQSLVGKLVSEVATRARQSGVPCYAVVGQDRLGAFEKRILDLQVVLEATTLAEMEAAGASLAATILAGHRGA